MSGDCETGDGTKRKEMGRGGCIVREERERAKWEATEDFLQLGTFCCTSVQMLCE